MSRVDGRTGVIAIEASDPVPYIASQPDPRLFVIELRDTSAVGFADDFKPDPRLPFAAVQVETDRAVDGESVARVRMMLAEPMRPARAQRTQRDLRRGGPSRSRCEGRRSHQQRGSIERHS